MLQVTVAEVSWLPSGNRPVTRLIHVFDVLNGHELERANHHAT